MVTCLEVKLLSSAFSTLHTPPLSSVQSGCAHLLFFGVFAQLAAFTAFAFLAAITSFTTATEDAAVAVLATCATLISFDCDCADVAATTTYPLSTGLATVQEIQQTPP
jgi:hypothetical protein